MAATMAATAGYMDAASAGYMDAASAGYMDAASAAVIAATSAAMAAAAATASAAMAAATTGQLGKRGSSGIFLVKNVKRRKANVGNFLLTQKDFVILTL
jgi:hypothetical protein